MNQIRIGNQTSKIAAYITLPFEYALERGFDAFEWFPDKDASGTGWEVKDLDIDTRRWIRRSGKQKNIRFSVHAPLRADPFKGSGASGIFDDSLDLLEEIGASLLNIHFPSREDLPDAPEALEPLIRRLHKMGVQLAIENTPSTSPGDVNMLFSLLQNTNLPVRHLGFCLDLGHANLFSAAPNDFLSYLNGIHEKVPVIHVHAHENYGYEDSHLPLFSGPAAADDRGIRGFVDWLRIRHFSGMIILEQWPDPPGLLDYARGKLIELFNLPASAF